jgi:phytoene dehydrogenase-like protein
MPSSRASSQIFSGRTESCTSLAARQLVRPRRVAAHHLYQLERLGDASESPAPAPWGAYLCGAATRPAGSVIALNGRNAVMAVLADAQVRAGVV